MGELQTLTGPDQITAEWLTGALRSGGALKDARVTSFDAQIIGEGAGFMGQLARLRLQYDRPEADAPASLIAKLPAAAQENREVAGIFRFYEREVRFYDEIADEVELRIPRRYYGAWDAASGNYVLLLEDLAPAAIGDQVAGCPVEKAELSIRNLAKFHATWWESPRLAQLDWMPFTNDPLIAQSAQDSYQKCWGPFLEFMAGKVSPAVRDVGERLGSRIPPLLDRFGTPPRTIVHGDYRLDNIFFASPEGGPQHAVIDWQISSRGRGVFDVAYFVCGTVAPAERRACEMELLRMYHAILTEHGVRGYTFEQCLEDYRASVLFCLGYAVIAAGSLDMANERGVELFQKIAERSLSAIEDLNAGELLPD